MAPFVQVIEFHTSKLAELEALGEEWERSTEGKRKARRRILCEDRDSPGRYFNLVFFDSYEDAMDNSALPETHEFAQQLMGYADQAPSFYNLDVVEDRQLG